MSYYANKLNELADIFGVEEVSIVDGSLQVGEKLYPIIDDVIILLEFRKLPPLLQARQKVSKLQQAAGRNENPESFAEDIQFTFGEEWKAFNQILPEHEKEFGQYFDITKEDDLAGKRVCDMGCGIGRWSYFLHKKCRSLVLLDFSEAIFEARKNLSDADNAIFFMGDIKELPFRDNFTDFIFSLGVLHHLPSDALSEVRSLAKYAPTLLIYLYYALDNRPIHFRILLHMATIFRLSIAPIRNKAARDVLTWLIGAFVYVPFVWLGKALKPIGLSSHIPLYDGYYDKGFARIRQDVYDRFFTRIEQRVTKDEIMALSDTFNTVEISSAIPYWHFICRK